MIAYKIVFSETAKTDIVDMLEVLSHYYENTALNQYDKIMESIGRLAHSPFMCEVYHKRKQYRRLVVQDYLVFYQIDEENRAVKIYRVLYGKRDITKLI